MVAINNKQNITFTALKFNNVKGMNIPEKFHTKLTFNDMPVDCFVSTKIEDTDFFTRVSDVKDNELGVGRYLKLDDELFNMSVNNFSDIKGVGSLLHLNQIITMVENNIPKIKLFALGSAIQFHSKFKFKSDFDKAAEIKDFIVKELFLNSEHRRAEELNNVRNMAKKWFAAINEGQSADIQLGNEILNEYIKVVDDKKLYLTDKYNPIQGMEMVLTRQSVNKNKDFFNKMFKKFGIDYQIDKGV